MIQVYDELGNVIETHEHVGRFQRVVSGFLPIPASHRCAIVSARRAAARFARRTGAPGRGLQAAPSARLAFISTPETQSSTSWAVAVQTHSGSDFSHPPSATYPDNQVSNMACGLLTRVRHSLHLLPKRQCADKAPYIALCYSRMCNRRSGRDHHPPKTAPFTRYR